MNSPLLRYKDVLTSNNLRVEDFCVKKHECVGVYGLEPRERELLIHLATGTAGFAEGTITVFGRDTRELDEPSWFDLMALVGICDTPRFNEDVSIGMNLAAGLTRAADTPLREPKLSSRVLAIANVLELTIMELASHSNTASPTLQFKAALGGVISHHPQLLFFDDRETHPEVRQILPRLLRRLRSKCNLTIVLFTNDLQLLSQLANRVVFVNTGTGSSIEMRMRGWYHTLFPFLPLSASRQQDLATAAERYDHEKKLLRRT